MVSAALALIAVCFGSCASAVHREGEDYVSETAEAVLSNKQEVLKVPWEIFKDKDIGYMGDFNIKDSCFTEVKVGSLNTTREQEGFPPDTIIGSIRIKDTQQPATPPSNYRVGGAGGEEIVHLNGAVNPTADLTVWSWQKNRWSSLAAWMQYWIETRRVPTKLAVIHSNGDVLYGGCSEAMLEQKYQQVIDAVGTGTQKIVAAGEVSPYPVDMGWYYGLSKNAWTEARRNTVLTNLQVNKDWAEAYANCTDTLCNSPPKYEFANAGVLMGPMVDLYDMLKDLPTYTGDFNRLVNEYYLKNQDKMTIDYSGNLALSLHNMGKDGNLPIEVDTTDGKKTLKSKVTGKTVCFVHGNGNSFPALKTLAASIVE